jgi:hypothetical protein
MVDHSALIGGIPEWSNPWARCAARLLSPGLVTRAGARLRRMELDHALAGGADPARSPLLAARASQLAGRASRHRIAAGLERVALTVDGPRGRFTTAPLRDAVRANREHMIKLAAVLRHGGVLYARGIAVLELVLIDGTGPAYTDPRGEGLARQLQLAAQSLSG